MNRLKFLFLAMILQGSSLYADANLQDYVESVSYEKGELLCYSVAYPLYLQMQPGRIVSPLPVSSRHHLFWRDAKYRRAMLEWMLLSKNAFESALDSRADESLLTLYAQYPIYLVNSEGFQNAIEDCSIRYYPGAVYDKTKLREYTNFLQSQIREKVLLSNKSAAISATVSIEVPAIFVGGPVFIRVIGGVWRGIKWLYRVTGNGYRRLRGLTSAQTAILQTQKQQFESMTRGFFHFTRGEMALETGLLLSIIFPLSTSLSAHYEDVQDEVFEQEIRDLPSTRLSPLPEGLFHHHVDEDLHTRLETWWKAKIEDYRVLLIQRGLNIQRLEETDTQSAELYSAFSEYRVWADRFLVDYWLIKGVVDWFRRQTAENRFILPHHRRSYEILRATLQILDMRKRQLEREMEELENGNVVNVNYRLEHLRAIFTILEESRETHEFPYGYNYSPYAYCLELEDYKKCVFSNQAISETQEWQLCRFHQLQIFKQLGNDLCDFEEREFRQLLQVVSQF